MYETQPVGPATRAGGLRWKAGEVISGRYAVTRALPGDRYEVVDVELHQKVALAVIGEGAAPSIQLLRRVSHPAVRRVHDLGRDGETLYVTMELLGSETLEERLRRGPLPAREAAALRAQLDGGLRAAHDAGVVFGGLAAGDVVLEGGRAVIGRLGGEGSAEGDLAALDALLARPRVRRWPFAAAAALLLAGIAFALAFVLRPAPAPPGGRRAVAVLAMKNLTGRPETAWLSTALGEMLGRELGARDELRVVAGETVARVEQELGLGQADGYAADTLARLRARLGAEYVVVGSYLDVGGRDVRVDLRLQDTATGETVVLVGDSAAEEALAALAGRAGERLRAALGVEALSPDETRAVRASLPRSPEAARLYAEALTAMRTYACRVAVDRLERLIAIEPAFPLAHAALADAYWFLGYEDEARHAAQQALARAGGLAPVERQLVEARVWETSAAPAKEAAIYRELFARYPDNAELGFRLFRATVNLGDIAALRATLEALRRIPWSAGDPRLDHAAMLVAGFEHDLPALRAATVRLGERAAAQGALPLLMEARATAGNLAWGAGDFEAARASMAEARRQAIALDDRHAAAGISLVMSRVLLDAGRLAEAETEARAALGGTARGQAARRLLTLGLVALERGDAAAAEEQLAAARAVAPPADWLVRAELETAAGRAQRLRGELAPARVRLEAAAAGLRRSGASSEAAYALFALAETLVDLGDATGARARAGEALAVWESRGAGAVPVEAARCRVLLAEIALAAGDAAGAETAARAALAELGSIADADTRARAGAALARALVALGRVAEARLALPPEAASERPVVRERVERARVSVSRGG